METAALAAMHSFDVGCYDGSALLLNAFDDKIYRENVNTISSSECFSLVQRTFQGFSEWMSECGSSVRINLMEIAFVG